MEPWAINIDIEGFSVLWDKEDKVLWSLGELMRAIFRIAWKCYPKDPERLFVHQLGDGFLIKSDFSEYDLDRAVTIAVALMRHVAMTGRLARAAITEGELSDIQNCYPSEVLDKLESDHTVSLDMGLMTVFPVMVTALIRSFKLAAAPYRGPLLIIEESRAVRISNRIPIRKIESSNLLSIDWVHMDTPLLRTIQEKASVNTPTSDQLENMLTQYCVTNKLPADWIKNTGNLLGISIPSS